MRRERVMLRVVAGVCVLGAGALLVAGPLSPPAGPVTGTYKTLSEVEPRIAISAANTPGDADSLYRIAAPGSYYLTGNVTGVAGKHGIEIAVSGVTLDLNGFDLVGIAGMGAFDGVSATVSNLKDLAVINGTVRMWGDEGVDLSASGVKNGRITDVRADANTGDGIRTGHGFTLTGCSAAENLGNGILTGIGCTVTDCTASYNGLYGINANQTSTITGCSAFLNEGNGISAGDACTITNSSAYFNTGDGIQVFSGCAITNCSGYSNGETGIRCTSGGTISDCQAHRNDLEGILGGASCTFSACAAYLNTGDGISASSGAVVSRCSVSSNSGHGISVTAGSTVTDCAAAFNLLTGIRCTSGCGIRGNTCTTNGNGATIGSGINATSSNNRIEGNNCTGNDFGIDIDVAGNMIVRNSCANNTQNWVIAADNIHGPILDRTAPGSPAVIGNVGAGTMGSSDSNANFSY